MCNKFINSIQIIHLTDVQSKSKILLNYLFFSAKIVQMLCNMKNACCRRNVHSEGLNIWIDRNDQ